MRRRLQAGALVRAHRHRIYFVIGLFAEHQSSSQASFAYLRHL